MLSRIARTRVYENDFARRFPKRLGHGQTTKTAADDRQVNGEQTVALSSDPEINKQSQNKRSYD